MIRVVRLTVTVGPVLLVLVLAGGASAQDKRLSLETTDGLELQHVKAEPVTLQGKRGLRLTISDEARKRLKTLESTKPEEREKHLTPDELSRIKRGGSIFEPVAAVKDVEFSSGTIEVELAGAPEPGAPEGARGFVGVAFRTQPDGSFDTIYLRPTNGRAEDQERRNHSVQYAASPDWPWFRLRKETPGRYESYVDLVPGEWTKIRIEVRGDKARLYVHDNSQPTLIVNDVKSGAQRKGGVALTVGPGSVTHFRNLTIKSASAPNQN